MLIKRDIEQVDNVQVAVVRILRAAYFGLIRVEDNTEGRILLTPLRTVVQYSPKHVGIEQGDNVLLVCEHTQHFRDREHANCVIVNTVEDLERIPEPDDDDSEDLSTVLADDDPHDSETVEPARKLKRRGVK